MKEGKDKSAAICNGWKEAAFWFAGAGELGLDLRAAKATRGSWKPGHVFAATAQRNC